MLRLLVSALPTILAVAVAVAVLRLPAGDETPEERFKKLVGAALAVGLLVSLITYSVLRATSPEAEKEQVEQETTKKVTAQLNSQCQTQIGTLNQQVVALQRELASRSSSPQLAQASSNSTPAAPSGLPQVYWTQTKMKDSADVQVSFKIYGALKVPAFAAICEGPCTTTGARAGSASEGTQLQGSAGNNVAGYVFKEPRPMPAGTEGYLLVRGVGKGGVKVQDFKILSESEIPESLK